MKKIKEFLMDNFFDIRIKKNFHIRGDSYVENNHTKYTHTVLIKGELYGKNIWFFEISRDNPQKDKLKGLEYSIVNYQYVYGKTYNRISNFAINTHIDFIKRGKLIEDENHPRLYIKLNWWDRIRLKIMLGETGYHRKPIEFLLLIIAAVGLLLTSYFSYQGLKNQQKQEQQVKHIIIEESYQCN